MVRFMYASLSSCVNISGRGDAAAFLGATRENAEEPYRRDFAYLPETGLVAAAVAGRDGVWELLLTSTAGAAIARAPLADVIRWRLSLATGTGDAASRFVSISGSEVTLGLEVLSVTELPREVLPNALSECMACEDTPTDSSASLIKALAAPSAPRQPSRSLARATL